MRLELSERLRCPAPHAPTPLIVVAQEVAGRELLRGFAGCPVCQQEARVTEGVVRFPGFEEPSARVSTPHTAPHALERLRAQLNLGEEGGAALLMGRYAAFALALGTAMEIGVVTMLAPRASVRLAESVVPFSDHTFRAVAMDATANADMIREALRVTQPGGRILGALPLALPLGVKELARDAVEWVGERGASDVVVIRRA